MLSSTTPIVQTWLATQDLLETLTAKIRIAQNLPGTNFINFCNNNCLVKIAQNAYVWWQTPTSELNDE